MRGKGRESGIRGKGRNFKVEYTRGKGKEGIVEWNERERKGKWNGMRGKGRER